MIRLIGFAFLFPLILLLLWDDAPQWAIIVAWGAGFGLIALAWSQRRLMLNCPSCGKGVKMGATHCHHCGREVVTTES